MARQPEISGPGGKSGDSAESHSVQWYLDEIRRIDGSIGILQKEKEGIRRKARADRQALSTARDIVVLLGVGSRPSRQPAAPGQSASPGKGPREGSNAFLVLSYLENNGPSTVGGVAKALDCKPSTVSSSLRSLARTARVRSTGYGVWESIGKEG